MFPPQSKHSRHARLLLPVPLVLPPDGDDAPPQIRRLASGPVYFGDVCAEEAARMMKNLNLFQYVS